jgi:hypothetical protein
MTNLAIAGLISLEQKIAGTLQADGIRLFGPTALFGKLKAALTLGESDKVIADLLNGDPQNQAERRIIANVVGLGGSVLLNFFTDAQTSVLALATGGAVSVADVQKIRPDLVAATEKSALAAAWDACQAKACNPDLKIKPDQAVGLRFRPNKTLAA